MRSHAETLGFTLVEMLVTALIVMITVVGVGSGFVKLASLEETNREKARVLEALCVRAAIMQPRVAIGAAAFAADGQQAVMLRYPKIVFGVAFETNQFLQVTNYLLRVEDGSLKGDVYSAKESNRRQASASYEWMDEIFVKRQRQSQMISNSVATVANGLVLRFAADVPTQTGTDAVVLGVPVRLRNQAY